MKKQLWRDLELDEKILPGDRCYGADHKWFELTKENLTFRHIMCEQSYPTQRKVSEELSDAWNDLAYKNGFNAGWNANEGGDVKALQSVGKSGQEARKFITQQE